MLWILLIRNANTNTNTKSFYHNSIAHPENKTCRVDIVTSRNRDYRPYAISELSFLYIYYWKYTEWNEVHTVNPGSISSRFFFSPLNVRECCFGQRSYTGFFSYLYAHPGYTVDMYIFSKINQPPPHPHPARLRNAPPDKPLNWPLQKIPQHTIMRFVCHPKILHKHCFEFLLGLF